MFYYIKEILLFIIPRFTTETCMLQWDKESQSISDCLPLEFYEQGDEHHFQAIGNVKAFVWMLFGYGFGITDVVDWDGNLIEDFNDLEEK